MSIFGISDNASTTTILAKYPLLMAFCENLHGSGINYNWFAEENKNNIILYNKYDVMNSCGMEIGAEDFKIIIPKNDLMNFKITFSNKNRYWINSILLSEYLEQITADVLSEIIKQMTNIWPNKRGFIEETIYRLTPIDAVKEVV